MSLSFKEAVRKFTIRIGLPDTNASIWYVVGLMSGAIVLIAYFSIIPLIGYNMEAAVTIPTNNTWNASYNSQMVTGVSLWNALGPIAKTGAITAGIAAMILIVMTLAGGFGQRQ